MDEQEPGENGAVLAEIFLLRLQLLVRDRVRNESMKSTSGPRFVPIVVPIVLPRT